MTAITLLRRAAAVLLCLIACGGLATWAWRILRPAPPSAVATAALSSGRVSVVYYLHANFRCVTCNAFEKATAETLSGLDLPAGQTRPVLRVENFQKPGNERFIRDFQVVSATVLLAEEEHGRIVRGRPCPEIWNHAGEPGALRAYLQGEMRDFFLPTNGSPDAAPSTPARPLGLWLAMLSAIGLGLLTAISPCPLASNIAAISFLARGAASPRTALLGGLAYTAGRTAAYTALGAVIAGGLLAVPAAANFLTTHMSALLGPLLIIVAVFLLRLVEASWSLGDGLGLQRWAQQGGIAISFGLGALFALAFCPTSAALFFGSLIPMCIVEGRTLSLPAAYGLATAAPVAAFAVLLVFAAHAAGRVFNQLSRIETWLRWVTGLAFLGIGLYFTGRLILLPS